MRNKGLFILHEGVGSTIFQSQVLEHVLCMQRAKIKFDVLTFDTFPKTRNASKNNLKILQEKHPLVKVTLKFGMYIYLPFSTLVNALLLAGVVMRQKNNYSFIHARADYSTFLCLLTRPIHKLPVIWDCRGDSVDELRDALSRQSGVLRYTLGSVLLMRQKLIVAFNKRFSDGAIFVSHELFKQHSESLHTKKHTVIPCPVPEDKFYFDNSIRKKMRKQYGISKGQRVFVYSGSVVAYQGLSEQIELYKNLLLSPRNVIIFATSNSDYAKEYFRDLMSDRFLIVSVEYDKMNEIYNLADFAFMLRESKQLNWVSSPTKFGEYCLSGLAVIMNDTIQQASVNAKALGLHVKVDDILNLTPLQDDERCAITEEAKKYYSRKSTSCNYTRLYEFVALRP
jgi:glycosyltransferase involved in cell wall biosynthesis